MHAVDLLITIDSAKQSGIHQRFHRRPNSVALQPGDSGREWEPYSFRQAQSDSVQQALRFRRMGSRSFGVERDIAPESHGLDIVDLLSPGAPPPLKQAGRYIERIGQTLHPRCKTAQSRPVPGEPAGQTHFEQGVSLGNVERVYTPNLVLG